MAKRAGVGRFLFSSSCSLYGAAEGDSFLNEQADLSPATPYRHSKVLSERDVAGFADDDFSPTFLRNATAYGVSPGLRGDLVVNNLVGLAFATGAVHLMSDGTPWRPLVHVEDVAATFLAVLEAPRELVHGEAFNVGRTAENYRISEVAEMVREVVPGGEVTFAEGAGPDPRCYRMDCAKLATTLPDLQLRWTVRRGVEQLYQAFKEHGLQFDDLTGRFQRLARIKSLMESDRLDADLRWRG